MLKALQSLPLGWMYLGFITDGTDSLPVKRSPSPNTVVVYEQSMF